MASVGSKDTGPEMAVRRMVYGLGHRYRLHRRDLPGTPDIAFIGRKKAIFVHGCFWHGHGCRWGQLPKSRPEYWGPKIASNRERDSRKEKRLRDAGWDVLVVWQCETRDPEGLLLTLSRFLVGDRIP